MNALTGGCFLFLALIISMIFITLPYYKCLLESTHLTLTLCAFATTDFSCASQRIYFKLDNKTLTATEGSCTEIECFVHNNPRIHSAYWFWMKDAKYRKEDGTFDATIIYSTDPSKRPVSKDFEGRVRYTGSPPSSWENPSKPSTRCNIMICNLSRADSGNYTFRFRHYSDSENAIKWATQPLNLKVTGKQRDQQRDKNA